MKKIKTLKMNYEFKNVFTKGKYYIGRQVILYIYRNKYEYNRIGVAVSTKSCKAVYRNKIKRIVRAAYQTIIKENNVISGYDFVFVWNKKCKVEDLSYNIVFNDIVKDFKKAQLITENNRK